MTWRRPVAVTASQHQHAVDLSLRLLAVAAATVPQRRHPLDGLGGRPLPPNGARAMRDSNPGCVRLRFPLFDPGHMCLTRSLSFAARRSGRPRPGAAPSNPADVAVLRAGSVLFGAVNGERQEGLLVFL
jgi:hypothetical protein